MRGILAGIAVATVGFSVYMMRLVPQPGLGLLPPDAHVNPLGIHTVLGGTLFGLGMVLAGGCVSGTIYRMGEGYVGSWVTFAAILGGLFVATRTWNWWWSAHIGRMPDVWLPQRVGYGGALFLSLLGLLTVYILLERWERKQAGEASSIADPLPPPISTPSGRSVSLLQKAWPVVPGGLILGALNVFLYVYKQPWGLTGPLSSWAIEIARSVGVHTPTLLGVSQISGCSLKPEHSGFLVPGSVLNVGLIAGAFTSAILAGEFKPRLPRNPTRYAQSIIGGLLMGYGAGIAFGCTIGAFFSAIPSLGLNGWVYGLSLAGGAYLGTLIIQRL